MFVDIGSFERLREGEPWVGYRQFCMLYLYPLLLQAVKDVPFHPWLRGSIDGITAGRDGVAALLPRPLPPWPVHQRVPARPAREALRRPAAGGQGEVKRAGLKKEIVMANVRKMRKLVSRLEWSPPEGVWTAYGERNTYTDDDAARKDEFVRSVATSRHWDLVWDIGANNGRYSRIAAEGASTVVAVDADQGPVELLYRDLRERGRREDPDAHHEPRRPLARPRLARPRAEGRCRTAASPTWCWRSRSSTTWRSAPTCR